MVGVYASNSSYAYKLLWQSLSNVIKYGHASLLIRDFNACCEAGPRVMHLKNIRRTGVAMGYMEVDYENALDCMLYNQPNI